MQEDGDGARELLKLQPPDLIKAKLTPLRDAYLCFCGRLMPLR